MSQAFASHARSRFASAILAGAVRSLPEVVIATLAAPLLIGSELALVRADRPALLLVGICLAGIHSMVVLMSAIFSVSMVTDLARGLRGLPGRFVRIESLTRSAEMGERAQRTLRVLRVVLTPFMWANPLNPVEGFLTHLAFDSLSERLEEEYRQTQRQDTETYALFSEVASPWDAEELEEQWRRYSGSGAPRLLIPV